MGTREYRLRVDGHEVAVTNPDKLLFPDDRISKGDLLDYYHRIAPWILLFLRDRPVAMERYPDGIKQPGFFQKSVPSYCPDWIETAIVKKKQGGTARHVVCNSAATLAYLTNQACITPHVWLSRAGKRDRPDQMVFDLDPAGNTFDWCALSLKELLDHLDLPAYVKSIGSLGLHVVVPLKRIETFESVRSLARKLAMIVASQEPRQRRLEQHKEMRHGRVYLVTNRNAYAPTLAPPFAVRAQCGGPVSAPLFWHELCRKGLLSDGVTIRTIFRRPDRRAAPWADFWQRAASLGHARRQPEKLGGTRRVSQEAEFR